MWNDPLTQGIDFKRGKESSKVSNKNDLSFLELVENVRREKNG
jgi:hypothetical protein